MTTQTERATLGVREASRKYDRPVSTIQQWADRDQALVAYRPTRPGEQLLIYEDSLLEKLKATPPRQRTAPKAEAPAPQQTEHATPAPAVTANPPVHTGPFSKYDTAEMVQRFVDANYLWDSGTEYNYRLYLKPFLQAFPKLPVEPEPVEALLGTLPENGGSRYQHYRIWNTLYRWISGAPKTSPKGVDGRRNRSLKIPNVMADIAVPPKNQKERNSYSLEEVTKVIATAPDPQDRLILTVLVATQIRCEAAYNLTGPDVHGRLHSD